jgi:hypothetical protein
LAARVTPLVAKPGQERGLRSHTGFPNQIHGNIQIPDRSRATHQAAQALADFLPAFARVELRKDAQTAAEAANRGAQVMYRLGILRFCNPANPVGEPPEEIRGLLTDVTLHIQSRARITAIGRS